jgi:hypothetical protein
MCRHGPNHNITCISDYRRGFWIGWLDLLIIPCTITRQSLSLTHGAEPFFRSCQLGRNFDVTNGRAVFEAWSATWNLDINSAFTLGSRKTTENLDRVCRSQDLPNAERLLTSSPAFKYSNPNFSPYLAVALFEKNVCIFLSIYIFIMFVLLPCRTLFITTWHGPDGKHRLLLSITRVYRSAT